MPGPFSPAPMVTSTSVPASPPDANKVSMLSTRRRARGIFAARAATIRGSFTTCPASAIARVNSRSVVARSKVSPWIA